MPVDSTELLLTNLSAMVFELFMKIIFTPRLFFDSYFEVFDGVLVLVAFGLDVTLMVDVDVPVAVCKFVLSSATDNTTLKFSFHCCLSILENYQVGGWDPDYN